MADPILLSDVSSNLLPRTIAAPIFNRAIEQSAVMSVSRRIPLTLTGATSVPVSMDVPLADWVGEGDRKPVGAGSVGIKQMVGKKVAVLVPVSEEVARTNPAGLYDQLQQDLPTAIARAFDYAAVHGKKIIDGSTGPFADYLAATDKEAALGTTAQDEGGIWADVITGVQDVVDDNWDFTAFVADPRLRPMLQLATDTLGRPIFVNNLDGGGVAMGGNLAGYPIAYNRGIGGKLVRQSTTTDQGLRAVGGDFSQVAYGVGMDITIRVSNEASYVDADNNTHSAFQENLVLLLAEAYYGLVIGDTAAFVKYTTTPIGS